jgi:dCTP deaminase
MILNDTAIKRLARDRGMIAPFSESLVREIEGDQKVISYGLSGHGYDIRLSPRDFRLCKPIRGVLDPKKPNHDMSEPLPLKHDDKGSFFEIPPHSSCLGVAVERLQVPTDILVLCIGKSTYARFHIIANLTPAEAGWRGHLTLEVSNLGPTAVRVYANEGIVQLLFLQGDKAEIDYQSRAGKYQDQPEQVVMGRV